MNDNNPDFWESLSPGKAAALTVLVPSLYLIGLAVAWLTPMHFGFGLRPLIYIGLTVGLYRRGVVDGGDGTTGEIPGGASGR